MQIRTHFTISLWALIIATFTSCFGGGRVTESFSHDSVVTKSKLKKGVLTEKDFRGGKLIETRVYYGNLLVERYPIFKDSLPPSRISLRSGNSFFTKEGIDTLDVVNERIPPGHFAFQVSSATILSRVSHGVYVLKYAPSPHPEQDTIRVLIQVLQPENKRLGTGSFVSDSAFFIVK